MLLFSLILLAAAEPIGRRARKNKSPVVRKRQNLKPLKMSRIDLQQAKKFSASSVSAPDLDILSPATSNIDIDSPISSGSGTKFLAPDQAFKFSVTCNGMPGNSCDQAKEILERAGRHIGSAIQFTTPVSVNATFRPFCEDGEVKVCAMGRRIGQATPSSKYGN